MQGKIVVMTGATSGLGAAAAAALARQGARLVLVARDPARAEATLATVRSIAPDQAHRAVLGDLSLLSEMKRVGAEIAVAEPNIDLLINNAGAIFTTRAETADGLERTFATNHMSYFVLTNALIPSLKAGARIVSTASGAHHSGRLDFDDLQLKRGYTTFGAYGASKLCNILFTRELARRLAGAGVTANCHHPGFVATRFAANNGLVAQLAMMLGSPFALSPEKGARTLLYLATSPEVAQASGQYFIRCKPATPSPAAQDDEAAVRLWVESGRISG